MPRRPAPDVLPFLQRAQELMATHDYAGAAAAYEQSARALQNSGDARGARFILQAGSARILAGQNAFGLDHIRTGLALLAQRGEWRKLCAATQQILVELNDLGLTDEADGIYNWVKSTLPAGFVLPRASPDPKSLPGHCPFCDAPIDSAGVDWLDDQNARCAHCGRLLPPAG